MSEDIEPAVSNIPTAGFFLLLGIIFVVILAYVAGFTSPVFLIPFVVVVLRIWSLVLEIRKWVAMSPATRPALKFPVKPVFWTFLTLATLAVLVKEIGDGISNAYRF